MALRDSWTPLQDAMSGVPDSGSDISVEPINKIADAVIELEKNPSNNNYKGYPYIVENMDDYLASISLQSNTVTNVYGTTTESGYLQFLLNDGDSDVAEETVLILDLTQSVSNAPTIAFESNIKWLNGEPPTIETGKIYMFSFVRVKNPNYMSANCYLGIGGEFA